MSFFAYYMGPLRSVSSLTMWGPPYISYFAYYMGAPQVSFFAYYRGPPQISFFTYYMGAPLRSVSSLTKWGPSVQFLRLIFSMFKKNVRVKLSLGGPHIFEFPGGGKCPLLPPPAGAHGYTCSDVKRRELIHLTNFPPEAHYILLFSIIRNKRNY